VDESKKIGFYSELKGSPKKVHIDALPWTNNLQEALRKRKAESSLSRRLIWPEKRSPLSILGERMWAEGLMKRAS